MNFHDSERIAGILGTEGYRLTDRPEKADLIIFNTCSIREKAEQKFYSDLGRLRRIKKKNPQLKIGVGGCIAKQEGEGIFEKAPYVNLILGTQNLESLPELIKGKKKASLEDRPDYATARISSYRSEKVKAWVSIMYGCNNFCSYCVVPYTRGRERSRPWRDIYREVEELALNGYKEITLLGQNVNSYGRSLVEDPTRDERIDFPDLLYRLHEINGIERIRFVTSHPKDLSHKLIKAMKELPKVCEHIHLPLQAGSDRILHLMNRGYTYTDYKEKVNILRSEIPMIAITTDIITGFPCEREEDFEKTVKALEEIKYDGIYVFKYSKRPNTSALNLPDHLPEEVKAERLTKVLSIQDTITLKKNSELLGREVEILVEGKSKNDNDRMTGRTRTNKIVNFNGGIGLIGKLLIVKIIKARHHSLDGEPFDFAQGKTL
jgi:tRNA-2-methylthio-N6-dimethylallyladenosine synthase